MGPEQNKSDASSIEEIRGKTRSGLAWLTSTTLAWQVISWIVTLFTVKILSPRDFGLIAMSQAIFPYLALVATFGILSWAVQRVSLSDEEGASLQLLTLILGLFASALALLAAPFVARFFHEPEITKPFQWLASVFVFSSLQVVPQAILQRALRFKEIALCNLMVGVVRISLQLGLALLGFRYWSLVIGQIVGEAGAAAWFLYLARPRSYPKWNSELYREVFKFGIPATITSVLWIIYSTADNAIIGRYFGAQILGYYTMAFYLADLPLSKINGVVSPLLVAFFSGLKFNPSALKRAFLRANKSIVSITCPILLGLACVAPEVVTLFLNDHWLPMIPMLRVLCVVGLLRSLTASGSQLFYALNLPKTLLLYSLINVVTLPLAFYLGATWSYPELTGIYLAWLIVFPVCGITTMFYLVHKNLKIRAGLLVKNVLPALSSGVLMVLICMTIEITLSSVLNSPELLAAKVLAGSLSYVTIWYVAFRRDVLETLVTLRKFRSSN